jgi:predicted ATP-binding protein involved in virulence
MEKERMAQSVARLYEFRVRGLYGEFDHTIRLKTTDHVTAIIAPNGVGKTLCLKLIQAFFDSNWTYFNSVEFDSLIFKFDNNTVIQLNKTEVNAPSDLLHYEVGLSSILKFEMTSPSIVKSLIWQTDYSDIMRAQRFLRNEAPYMRRAGPNTWVDERDGERLTEREILSRYGQLPGSRKKQKEVPSQFNDLISSINCKLIETQRLIIIEDTDEKNYNSRKKPSNYHAISRKADALKRIISEQLNRYASLSQTLDRTFPRRVISGQNLIDDSHIREELIALDANRRDLMEVGILDADQDAQFELPTEKIEESVARVLSVYIEDNKKKLEVLSEIYERVFLFRELISDRFGSKKIEISNSKGMRIIYGESEVPLDRLSSGEQHQLVLFFELLFEIKPNTLILIDEPEISLHVAWQKKFISDLMKIIELNKFDVVLATHSPQLIGSWSHLLVELGDVN